MSPFATGKNRSSCPALMLYWKLLLTLPKAVLLQTYNLLYYENITKTSIYYTKCKTLFYNEMFSITYIIINKCVRLVIYKYLRERKGNNNFLKLYEQISIFVSCHIFTGSNGNGFAK